MSNKQAHKETLRMCIACHQRSKKVTLLKFVWTGTELKLDSKKRPFQARAAYVHNCEKCLAKVRIKTCWEKALKLEPHTIVELPNMLFVCKEESQTAYTRTKIRL